jgi:SAM-dependent methyltransferase
VQLQEVYLQRQDRTTPQYYCMECETFFHVSGHVDNGAGNPADAAWLVQHPGVENEALAKEIVQELGARDVFEAGCGVGELLLAIEAQGASAAGVDPNGSAVEIALERGARASVGYFIPLDQPVDAVLAIDVLEHLEEPRVFFRQLRASVREGGHIIVRVPEVRRDQWRYLKGADQPRQHICPDPFDDNSVHITGFSPRGVQMMGESLCTTYLGRIAGGCHLFKRPLDGETVKLGREYHFNPLDLEAIEPLLGDGWSKLEDGHIWSVGEKSHLKLPVTSKAEQITILMSGNPFVDQELRKVTVLINDVPVRRDIQLQLVPEHHVIDLGDSSWRSVGNNLVTFMPERAASGADDHRKLGICLYSMKVT